jgi:hypothetical protein
VKTLAIKDATFAGGDGIHTKQAAPDTIVAAAN